MMSVTERASEALIRQGYDPERSFLLVQHVLGCGGAGFRLALKEHISDGFHVMEVTEASNGIRIAMDSYSAEHLKGAVIDYDENEEHEENEGFRLEHPNAAFAAFC
jgi:Fe-S cluster assembly iron-binding protein IscA